MATKREIVGINVPVRATLDKGSVSKLMKDIADIKRQMGPLDKQFIQVAKSSQKNVQEIQSISNAAGAFAKKLSKATKDSVKELKKLGDDLKDAGDQAEELQAAYGAAGTAAEKSKIADQLNKMRDRMAGANKAIEDYRKSNVRAGREIQNTIKDQKKYQAALKDMASYTGKDTMKGMGGGLLRAMRGDLKGGLGDAFKSAGKGVQGSMARGAEARAAASGGGDVAAAAAGESMVAAVGAMAGAVAVVALFVKLLLAASDHMTALNKNLLQGTGVANEFGSSALAYKKSIDNIRNASIDAAGSLLKFGGNSETAMQAVNAYTKEASGSIIKTEIQLKSLGGGNLSAGIGEFTKNALIYGKALNMEVGEVSSLMGKMVGEIGLDADNVQKTMGNIVKQASQAGMPVNKFMGIFKESIPNLDLFTNRIEELTGTMKLLSKTMDPRAVSGFMRAFGKGFDQMDFKQRLKMALVVGPGEMGKIMNKDIKRAGETVKNELPVSIQNAFDDALKGGNNVKKMAKVAADAAAMGVDGAKIANMTKMARYKQNSQGGVLKQASGMRDMGMSARMDAMEAYANKFTGGDISGLGEHIVKQLGVSEDEYKALLDLKASMGMYTASIAEDGMTSSTSINKNLRKIWKQDNKNANGTEKTDEEAKKALQLMATKNPKQLEGLIKDAATMQMDADADDAKKQKDELESASDLAAEQITVTQSISDKITNILQVLLEKIYQIMDDVFGTLGDLYDMLPNWLSKNHDKTKEALSNSSRGARSSMGPNNAAGAKYVVDINNNLKQMLEQGKDSKDMIFQNLDVVSKSFMGNQSVDMKTLQATLKGIDNSDEFLHKLDVIGKENLTFKKIENVAGDVGISPDDMAKILSRLAEVQGKKMTGQKVDFGYGTNYKDAHRMQDREARQRAEAKVTGDLDPEKLAARAAAGGEEGAEAAKELAKLQETANKTAESTNQSTVATADTLKKGVKFDQSWMNQKYKGVLKDASLDAFRPALAEYLMAYMRLTSNEQVRNKYLADPDSGGLDLATIGHVKTQEEMDRALEASKAQSHAAGGVASYTGLHTLTAGERVLPAGQSGGGGSVSKSIAVGGIHIHGIQDPRAVAAAVEHKLDEIARRH